MSVEGWKTLLLGDISQFRYGKMPDKSLVTSEGDYPVFSGYRINGYYPKYNCEEERLIVVAGGVGGTGDVKINKEKCWLTNLSIEFFVDDDKASVTFLYYYFLKDTLRHLDSGSAQSQITIDDLKRIYIELPDLPTQTRIAAILSALDDKIELNRQTNATLEAIAQAIFKEWFVDFHFPGATGEMQDSELGPIPKGWRVGKIGEICEVNKNTISKRDVFEQIEYLEISGVNRGVISKTTIYSYGAEPSRAKRKLSHGDTVLSTVRPNRGAYFLALNPSSTLIASTGFAVFSPITVPSSFLYLFLTASEQLEYYGHVADGGAYPAINSNLIIDIDLVVPSTDVLNDFQSIVESLFEALDNNNSQSTIIAQTRDVLLPKLMSGEIEV